MIVFVGPHVIVMSTLPPPFQTYACPFTTTVSNFVELNNATYLIESHRRRPHGGPRWWWREMAEFGLVNLETGNRLSIVVGRPNETWEYVTTFGHV